MAKPPGRIMARHLQPGVACVCQSSLHGPASRMPGRLQQKVGIRSLLGRNAKGAQQGAAKERKQPHTSEVSPTCRAETVLLLGSRASSSRALCNASAGDAQVMLEELCRCTARINHPSIFLLVWCTAFPLARRWFTTQQTFNNGV